MVYISSFWYFVLLLFIKRSLGITILIIIEDYLGMAAAGQAQEWCHQINERRQHHKLIDMNEVVVISKYINFASVILYHGVKS